MRGSIIPYTEAELAWIKGHRDLPRRQTHAEFVVRFNRSDVSLINFNSLCKRNGWLTGRTGRYQPGIPPHNKGLRMAYNANSAATRFKPGQTPANYRGPGHESIDKDGYVWIVTDATNPHTGAATNRVMKHRWLWEQAHGPIPKGHVLKCLDGDKSNCAPANWALIDRALLPRLNGRFGRNYDTAPADLKPVIMATAKLEHKAREVTK